MRKRNCKNLFDNIMWYTIYLLPIIMTLVIIGGVFQGDWFSSFLEVDGDFSGFPFYFIFQNVMGNIFSLSGDNPIYVMLNSVFCEGGILPMFTYDTSFLFYFAYIVSVYLIHLCIDFILFIPRLAHKWMNSFTRSDD